MYQKWVNDYQFYTFAYVDKIFKQSSIIFFLIFFKICDHFNLINLLVFEV